MCMYMKRTMLAFVFAGLLVVSHAQPVRAEEAPAPKAARGAREYRGRVQLHALPGELQMPGEERTDAPRPTDTFEPEWSAPDLSAIQTIVPQISPPPARRERDKERKDRSWIRLDSEAKGVLEKEKKPPEDAGWGWLAGDVLERQESERTQSEAKEEEELGAFLLPTERLLRSASGQNKLLAEPMVSPMPATRLVKDAPSPQAVQSMLVMDESTAAEPRQDQNPTAASSPEMYSAQADRGVPALSGLSGGYEANAPAGGWDRDPFSREPTPQNVLPQTAALMARPAGLNRRESLAGPPSQSGGMLPGTTPSPATTPSLFQSPAPAVGSTPYSPSWEKPAAASKSLFGSFESPGGMSSVQTPDAPASPFDRGTFSPTAPMTPAQSLPSATPASARPSVEFFGPSWRK